MISNVNDLARKYIGWGKDFLREQYGSYECKTTGMDIDEDTGDESYRESLKNEILKDESVSNCWWEKESYGYTLWIEF